MQATSTRQFVRNRSAGFAAAVAIVVLAAVAIGAIALNSTLDNGQASIGGPAVVQPVNKYEHMRFLEENTWQIPYTGPRVLSSEDIAFLESNTIQIPYSAPALSFEELRFLEENTLGYHEPSADYQIHGEAHVVQSGCAPEPLSRTQPGCLDY